MRLLTWNVNGLRSTLKKDFASSMLAIDADIICLQEVKAEQHQMRGPVLPGFREYWNSSAKRKGYSGTLILSKQEALSTRNGIARTEGSTNGSAGLEAAGEGRVICAEYDSFFLVNVYAPNSQSRLKRLQARLAWDAALLDYLKELENRKPVILCGDINVAHNEIDMAHPTRNRGKSGFSNEERAGFDRLLEAGYFDAFRHFETGPEHYTWWRFNKGTREKNLGWRIDYFVVSDELMARTNGCYLLPEIMGSDHCPVVLEIDTPG